MRSRLFNNKILRLYQQVRHQNVCSLNYSPFNECECSDTKPNHLICFKQWTSDMVMNIINGAISLKCKVPNTHLIRMKTLAGAKIMILKEVNQPILQMAVSKAATMLGANAVAISNHVEWDTDYLGRVFSTMADAIFVSTSTHMCVQRFAEKSSVPVLCMHSRTHSSIRALATIMFIFEEFGTMEGINIGYLGPSHPVLNSYLLLAPMLGANIKFKCCCDITPVSPLLFKASEEMTEKSHTQMTACADRVEVFKDINVLIAGPSTKKKDKIKHFSVDLSEIRKGSGDNRWFFIHTCPTGAEVNNELLKHPNTQTFTVFENMQYIAASLMINAIKGSHV